MLNQDIAVGGGSSDASRVASNASAVTSSEIKQSQSCEDVIGSSQDDLTSVAAGGGGGVGPPPDDAAAAGEGSPTSSTPAVPISSTPARISKRQRFISSFQSLR